MKLSALRAHLSTEPLPDSTLPERIHLLPPVMGRQSLSSLSLKIAPKGANTISETCQGQPGSAALPATAGALAASTVTRNAAWRGSSTERTIKISNTAWGGRKLHQELNQCGADEQVSKCCQCHVHVAHEKNSSEQKASQLSILCPRVIVILRFNARMKTNRAVKKIMH